MKISDETLMVLKNFSTINDSILIRPGNVLTTMHPMKFIAASAIVSEDFPVEAPIYALNKMISLLSLFKSPEVEFEESKLVISGPSGQVSKFYAAPTLIKGAPATFEKLVPTPLHETVSMTVDQFKSMMNAIAILGSPKVAFIGDGSTVKFQTWVDGSHGADNYSTVVGTTDKVFVVPILVELFKLIPRDYSVSIGGNLVQFSSSTLTYWIASDKKKGK